MMQFQGFKPDALKRIAGTLGYQGDMSGFQNYLMQNPDKQNQMNVYNKQAMQMARGGMVRKYAPGGYVGADGLTYDSERAAEELGGGVVNYTSPTTTAPVTTNPVTTDTTTAPTTTYPDMTDPVLTNPVINPPVTTDPVTNPPVTTDPVTPIGNPVYQAMTQQAINPALPVGGVTQPVSTITSPDQDIASTTGQVGAITAPTAAQTTASTATTQAATPAATTTAITATPQVTEAVSGLQGAQGTVSEEAQVTAATQEPTSTAVSSIAAAQGEAYLIDSPASREIQDGELISGVANAEKAALFTEQIQAATATPTEQATVKGQLDSLMQDFEGGKTPAWAAGALRAATSAMAARGLGASSMAGQAMIQAAMESALPIAQADASTFAQFEAQNLSNRQQRAMLAAEQRASFLGMEFDQAFQARVANAAKISDVANMNFTAEQQVILENARATNTMNLQNLSNRQANVMAEVAAIAQLETQNLNNRQQAAVQNAKAFLDMDMANLSNQQQMDVFAAQSMVQAMFTDQAAENAAAQFNATSKNQVDQFYASLTSATNQFNTAQTNAVALANTDAENAMLKFSQEIQNQRDQFNANNQLVIAQSNATWRRQIATADTAAINRANEINAAAILNISNQAYAEIWQNYADTFEMAWKSTENERDREAAIVKAMLQIDADKASAALANSNANTRAVGNALYNFFFDENDSGNTAWDTVLDWFS